MEPMAIPVAQKPTRLQRLKAVAASPWFKLGTVAFTFALGSSCEYLPAELQPACEFVVKVMKMLGSFH